ncbi:MAG TPA: glycosyltransferase [Firmicutes bacterium]|nr:glycosyltransferase [Bacillota bacterium]
MKTVSIVVPFYNEEEMFPIFIKKAKELFIDDESYKYELVLVNDGSKDKTLELIRAAARENDFITYISFSRNFGQEAALAAGLRAAKGDYIIPMDCDFQDPPELIKDMLKEAENGYEVVCPKRRKRDGDSFVKRFTSKAFYKFINGISGREVIQDNVSYFRLMTKRVVKIIMDMPETERLFKSEATYVGFKTKIIEFDRPERAAGKTKYNYRKLFKLAFRTITCSTNALLYLPLHIGIALSSIGFLGFVTTLVLLFVNGDYRWGINSQNIIQSFLIISSIILAVGIISLIITIPCLYLQNLMVNTQRRPQYIIEEQYEAPKTKE